MKNYLLISLLWLISLLYSCGASTGNDEAYYHEEVEEQVLDEFSSEKLKHSNSVDVIDLIPGKLAFDIPREMKVGERYDVTFSITKSLNNEVLFLGLDSTKFEIRNIEVSSGMKVLLYDPEPEDRKNFDISFDLSNEADNVQFVSSNRNATWLWHITPLKKGSHTIIAKVYATIYPQNGVEREINQIVFNEEIQVEATPSFTFTIFLKSTGNGCLVLY